MIERLRGWASWALLPALVLMQFFDLRRALLGPGWLWSCFLIGFALVVVVLLPLAAPNLRELRGPLGWVCGLFTVVIGYALVSAAITGPPFMGGWPWRDHTRPWSVPPRSLRIVPLVTAWLAMAAGVLMVLVIPPAQRVRRMWWAAMVIVASTLLAWPRSVLNSGSIRLATGMGGAAIVHLVLLLCCGLLTGAAVQGLHRRWSIAGALVAAGCVVLTGSRSGLICLMVLFGLLVLWFAGRVSVKLVGGLVLAGVVALAALLAVVPQARRVFSLGDSLRTANIETGLRVLDESTLHWIFGVGSGRLWPWYAWDARYFGIPWRGIVKTAKGQALTNPHSVPVGVLVELGLIGAVLVAALVVILLVRLVRMWRASHREGADWRSDAAAELALVAVGAGFVAFLFDFYLFKNFAVDFWWWAVVAWVLTVPAAAGAHPTARRGTARRAAEGPTEPATRGATP